VKNIAELHNWKIEVKSEVTGAAQKFLTAPLCRRYFAKKADLIEQGRINGVSISADELKILKNVNSKFFKRCRHAGNHKFY